MKYSGVVAGGAGGARAPPATEKMGAPKAPSVLRGRQMPESSIHTKSRWLGCTNVTEKSARDIFASNL